MNIIQRLASVEPIATKRDDDAEVYSFTASTEAEDSHGTIVRQSWDLSRFQANPIVLWNHDTDKPIGRAEVRVDAGSLVADIRLAKGIQQADEAKLLIDQGILKGVSVGFRPQNIAFKSEVTGQDEDGKDTVRRIPVFENNELFEISLAPVPSNPEALARSAFEQDLIAKAESESKQAAPAAHSPNPLEENMAEHATAEVIDTAPPAESRSSDPALVALQSVNESLTKENRDLSAEIAKLRNQNAELNEKRLADKVDALIGTKLDETQRDVFLVLAKNDEAQFDAIVETLAERSAPEPAPAPDAVFSRVLPPVENRASEEAAELDPIAEANRLAAERAAKTGESESAAFRNVLKANPHLRPRGAR